MPIFEVVVNGYCGESSETDGHVLWVKSPRLLTVLGAIPDGKARYAGVVDPKAMPAGNDIDFTLPEEHEQFTARIHQLERSVTA